MEFYMKFEKVSLKKSWNAPVLRVLNPNDGRVHIAAVIDPRFAAAVKAQSAKV